MYKWSGGIFAKKTKFHDAGGPGTVVSPILKYTLYIQFSNGGGAIDRKYKWMIDELGMFSKIKSGKKV